MKITIFDSKEYDKTTFATANKNNHELIFEIKGLSLETADLAKGSEGISLFVNCDASSKVLEKLSENGVKYIFQRSVGYNNIDLIKAKELGIQIYRVPGYSPEAVAEFAMTLLTAVNRNIHIANDRVKANNFALQGLQGDTIHGKTIGVLGAGRIGQCFIKIAKGFGAEVIVFDEFAQKNFPGTADELGFTYVDMDTVLEESDFISLHMPLMESTKHIINAKSISKMKKTAIIVNTSRGGLVNAEELLDSLDKGEIRGAGLDVYEKEAGIFFFDNSENLLTDTTLIRLRAHRNVLLTSHQAFFTNLALRQIAETTLGNVEFALNNELGHTGLTLQEDGKVLNG